MSYCRWSSDNWKSDLYCYESVHGGWTTHVAGRKRVGHIPEDRFEEFVAGKITAEEYAKAHEAHMDAVDATKLVDIGLPHDGETFHDATLESFRATVVMLKGAGYHVPDYVIPTIDEELAEINVPPEPLSSP